MDEQNTPDEEEARPIPPILHSAYLEGPFRECTSCGGDLSDPERLYQIHKTWRAGEVVFELALCADCALDTVREFSEESMRRMESYFGSHFRPLAGLDHCHFCQRPCDAEAEVTYGAGCRGETLIRPVIVICAGCTAASQENLSRKTRDAWGDFIDRTLPGVPRELEPENVPFTF